jgi:hypothetical protein
MKFDAEGIAKEIVGQVAAAQKSGPAGASIAVAAVKPSDFCTIWPKAKPVLDLLAGIVVFIPGAGTTAAAVLQGLIKVGDQVASQMCG